MKKAIIAACTWLFVIVASNTAHAQFFGSEGGNYVGPNTGSNYRGQEARTRQAVTVATVVDIREVQITSRRSGNSANGVGAGIGAVLGALAGNRIGEGAGKVAAQAVLGVVGAWGGSRVGEKLDTIEESAFEIVVELRNGEMVAVTQAIDGDAASLRIGDTVRLVEGRLVRVARHNGPAQAPAVRLERQTSYF